MFVTCLEAVMVVLACKVVIRRAGSFGNVTVDWSVNASDPYVLTERHLLPTAGTVSLLSGLETSLCCSYCK